MNFWEGLQDLVDTSEHHIERPKGTAHPRYEEFIYPFDYGYMKETKGSDGECLDLWVGSLKSNDVSGIIVTVDTEKRDSEINVLLGCTEADMKIILECHQRGAMKGLLIARSEPARV